MVAVNGTARLLILRVSSGFTVVVFRRFWSQRGGHPLCMQTAYITEKSGVERVRSNISATVSRARGWEFSQGDRRRSRMFGEATLSSPSGKRKLRKSRFLHYRLFPRSSRLTYSLCGKTLRICCFNNGACSSFGSCSKRVFAARRARSMST